jgi:hypothetical protein
VDDELARAVRSETVEALCHWLGVSASLVHSWRRALGVRRRTAWSPQELALLGTMKDRDVARLTGRSLMSVAGMRSRRAVPTFGAEPGRKRGRPRKPRGGNADPDDRVIFL